MKKILIAAACMSMIGSVQAQSNVTVYGVVDQYIDFSKAGSNHGGRIQSGGLEGSRFGFRGSEDLGGGMKALFVLEGGFNADDGTSGQGALFGRQSYVGLGGKFGQATVGRQYSTYYDTLVNYGLGGGLAWGNATEYFNDMSSLRINNSIKYESPNFGGLVLKGLYGMGESTAPGARSVGNVGSLGGQYEHGPFSLGMSYTQRESQPNNQERWTAFGTAYDFGPIKTAFLASDVRDDVGLNRSNTYEVSATIPLTNASLLLDIGRYRNRALANANASSYSLRYDYYLSKRTILYGGLAYIRSDRNAVGPNDATKGFGIEGSTGAGLRGAPGDSSHAIIAGIRHAF
ncbi:MAG TPA: porin [Herbaspirillum sp.]|jgi:predicted porin